MSFFGPPSAAAAASSRRPKEVTKAVKKEDPRATFARLGEAAIAAAAASATASQPSTSRHDAQKNASKGATTWQKVAAREASLQTPKHATTTTTSVFALPSLTKRPLPDVPLSPF